MTTFLVATNFTPLLPTLLFRSSRIIFSISAALVAFFNTCGFKLKLIARCVS
jgi:hypothetical protein